MKIPKAKVVVIMFAAFLASLFFVVSVSTSAKSTQITVDVNQVLADVSHKPLGIGLNFIGDHPQNIIAPLQQIKVGTLRFATNEYYLFDQSEPNKPKVAIQDPNLWPVKSFAKPDGTWWGQLNFDDFIAVCQSTDAEPFIVVGIDAIAYQGNATHASPEEVLKSAVDWVNYANVLKGYQVKYWEIGNESNLKNSELVNWTPTKYAQTVVQFSQAMKAIDPTIKIGANGMRIKKNEDWWGKVMPLIKDDVDYLVTHQYSWYKDYQEWENSQAQHDYNLKDAVKAIKIHNPKLRLNVTENSSFNPSISHANNTWKMLHNFQMLGEALSFNQVDYVHFWTSRWLETDPYAEDYSAFDANYQLTPMGYPLKAWNTFLKQQMVYTKEPSAIVNSWASYDPRDHSLSVFLLNKHQVSQNVTIQLNNYPRNSHNERWTLEGATPQSTDVTWSHSGAAVVRGAKIKTKLKPLSVTIISFPGKKQNFS